MMNKQYQLSILSLGFLAVLPCGARQRRAAMPEKPNVIYIYADDMGKGMLSAYGQQHLTTPNIDALIAEGTSFDNAYGCMLSAPARASLLTGYHDCHGDKWRISSGGGFLPTHGDEEKVAKVESRINAKDVSLAANDVYLPQVFKKAGYVTGQIGKLEWGFTATRQQMKAHGWDYYYGYLDHVRCHGYYPPFLFDNGEIVKIPGNTLNNCGKTRLVENEEKFKERWNRQGQQVYSQDIFVEKILQFIRQHKDEPFFLYHPSQLPHGPIAIPVIHPELMNDGALTSLEKEYGSMVKKLDETVGIIVNELRRLNIAKKTIVVFAADNGHEIYIIQQGRCNTPCKNVKTGELIDNYKVKYYSDIQGDIFNGNASMAGLKRSNLDGGVHIPLVFYGDGFIPAGVKNKELVSNYDFISTMAEMLNVELPVKKDGLSYWKTLMKGKKISKDRYVVFGSNYGPGILTNEGWKLRQYRAANVFELYNLREDPQERHDVSAQHPEIVEKLKAILLKECGGDFKNGITRVG